jgi:hypothetical protein
LHEERFHFVLVIAFVEVAHVALAVVMCVYGCIITDILATLRVLVSLLLLLEYFVLTDLLFQESFVFSFLIVSRHPCFVYCTLHINLIGTESFVMRYDQVNIISLSDIHMDLFVE